MTGNVEKKNYLTEEGVKALEEELEFLKSSRRQEVSQRIKEAIALGDLSENSEYDDAKNEQAFLEGRIAELEYRLSNAEIIAKTNDSGSVAVGSTVTLRVLPAGNVVTYTLVGSVEADPFNGRISNESPIGSALMGARLGETVEVDVPGGRKKFEVMEIKG